MHWSFSSPNNFCNFTIEKFYLPNKAKSPTTANISSSLSSSSNDKSVLSLAIIEEIQTKNEVLQNLCENEEIAVMQYSFLDHKKLLPFEVIAQENNYLILTHFKEKNHMKNQTLMKLLALKQNNFIENYHNSKKFRKMIRNNESLISHLIDNLDELDKIEENEKNEKKNLIKKKITKKEKKKPRRQSEEGLFNLLKVL